MVGISYEFNIVSSNGEITEESYKKIKDYYENVDRDIRVAEPISIGDTMQISVLEEGWFRAVVVEKVLIVDNCEKSEYTTRYGISVEVVGQKDTDILYGNFFSNMDGVSNREL